jgi:RNA polymerase sigma-70 factor (ECF subfamily)
LFTVARNLVIDDRRSARHSREWSTDTLPEAHSADPIGPAFDKWILSDALLSLSKEHRAVIVRTYYLGQSGAEIARQEQIAEGTVKSRCHYALRALRIALQERGVVR